MSDLDILARAFLNIGDHPDAAVCPGSGVWFGDRRFTYEKYTFYDRKSISDRYHELSGKPKEWKFGSSRFMIQSWLGVWYEFSSVPLITNVSVFTEYCEKYGEKVGEGEPIGRWRDTLEEREEMEDKIKVGDMVLLDADPDELIYGKDDVGNNHEVVAILDDENSIVLRLPWGLGVFDERLIKPAKTEREKVVEAMAEVMLNHCAGLNWAGVAEALYDAGYRKVEES